MGVDRPPPLAAGALGSPPTSFGPAGQPGKALTPQMSKPASQTPRIDPEAVPRPQWNTPEDASEWLTQGEGIVAAPTGLRHFVAVDTGNATPRFMRSTVCRVPFDAELASEVGVPMTVHVTPLARPRVDAGERALSCVDFGEAGPVRCARCLAYLNPFAGWMTHGRQWECNFCGKLNDTPEWYVCSLDSFGNRRDREQRVELNMGSIELAAPKSYWTGDTIPDPIFVFAVETTTQAIISGATRAALEAIAGCLNFLPGGDIVRVGIVGFDTRLHFMSTSGSGSQGVGWTVVSDLDDPFVPLPPDVWAPRRSVARERILQSLDALAAHATTVPTVSAATGAVLTALVEGVGELGGGRVSVFASSLPTIGVGSTKQRETVRAYGGDKEAELYTPQAGAETDFYLALAEKAVDASVGVDILALSSGSVDLPLLSILASRTGGSVEVHPAFDTNVATAVAVRGRRGSSAGAGGQPTSGPPTSGPPRGGPPTGGPPMSGPPTGGSAAADPAQSRQRAGTATSLASTHREYSCVAELPSCKDAQAVQAVVMGTRARLGREMGFNAVMKVRVSRGMRVKEYSGNFSKRTPTEIDFAVVDAGTSVEVTLEHDGHTLNEGDIVFVQAALLYNTAYGTRRVRVHNTTIHVAEEIGDVFKAVDGDAVLASVARQGARDILAGKRQPAEARTDLTERCVLSLLSYRRNCAAHSAPAQLILPDALKLLPLFLACLFKSPAFVDNDKQRVLSAAATGGSVSPPAPTTPGTQAVMRTGAPGNPFAGVTARADERVAASLALQNCPADHIALKLYGRVYPLHELDAADGTVLDEFDDKVAAAVMDGTQRIGAGLEETGLPLDKASIVPLPDATYPSAAKLKQTGVYLLDAGGALWLYVGVACEEELLSQLFGPDAAGPASDLPPGMQLPRLETGLNQRVWHMIGECRKWRTPFLPVRVVVPSDLNMRAKIALALVEDAAGGASSYVDMLCDMHTEIQRRFNA